MSLRLNFESRFIVAKIFHNEFKNFSKERIKLKFQCAMSSTKNQFSATIWCLKDWIWNGQHLLWPKFWRMNSNWVSSAPYLRESSRFWLEFEIWKTEFLMVNNYGGQNFREWAENFSKKRIKLKFQCAMSSTNSQFWLKLDVYKTEFARFLGQVPIPTSPALVFKFWSSKRRTWT